MYSKLDGLFSLVNDLKVTITPDMFIEILRMFNLGNEFSPIGIEFFEEKETFRVRVQHPTRDSMGAFIGTKHEEIGRTGYLVIDPKEILEILPKYKDSDTITITAKDNEQTEFTDMLGNWNTITPLDKSQLFIPFEKAIPEFDADGWFTWKQKENSVYKKDASDNYIYMKASTKITINTRELQKSIRDIKSGSCEYAEFHFGKESWVRAGHLGRKKKGNKANTVIDATVEGDEWNFVLLATFIDVLKKLSGEIEIYGMNKLPFIVVTKLFDYGRLIFVFRQPEEMK